MAWQEQGKQPPTGSVKEDAVDEVYTAGYKPPSTSLLIIGGIGSGKSTIGNTLLGNDAFRVGSNLLSSTRKAELQVCGQQQWMGHLRVLYTPSLPHVVNRLEEKVVLWKEMIGPFPDVILLVIKRDRYSLDEYKAYEAMKEAWGQDDFCQRLVIVFTHCGNRTPDLRDLCPSLPTKLQGILRDAEFRFLNFEKDQLPAQRETFLQSIMRHLWLIREAEGGLKADESKDHRDDIFKLFGQLDKDKNKDVWEFLKEKNQARQKEVQDVLDSLSKESMNKQKKQDGNGPHTKHLGIFVSGVVIAILLVGILIICLREDVYGNDLPPLSKHLNENQTL